MKLTKKIVALMLAVSLGASFVACSSSNDQQANTEVEVPEVETPEEETEDQTEEENVEEDKVEEDKVEEDKKEEDKKEETKPVETKPEQPKPVQPKPEQPKPVQPKPEQPKPEQPKPEQPKPEQPKPEQPKPEQPKPEQPKPSLSAEEVYTAITSKLQEEGSFPGKLVEVEATTIADTYGLDMTLVEDYKVMAPMMSGVITEVAIFKVTDSANVATVAEAAKSRLTFLQNGGAFYPSHVEIVQKGQVVTQGNYVLFVADENVETLVANFKDTIK